MNAVPKGHPPAGPGPLRAVLESVRAGATSQGAIARATGLSEAMVTLTIERLVRHGVLQRQDIAVGCDLGGCRGCAVAQCPGGPTFVTLGGVG